MGMKILVVDDEPIIVKLLTNRLEVSGYDVITATDGEKALEEVRREQPDLLILDIVLPKIDGYKLCELLKSDEKYSKIPVIMLSASVKKKDLEMAEKMGADAYMVKPFNARELLSKIKELLEK
ncbi:PleD family two-component system response regulator [Candidatus Omnitrophota bacterium]